MSKETSDSNMGPKSLQIDQYLRNLENAKSFAIDIGGSLTKIAYLSCLSHHGSRRNSGVMSDEIPEDSSRNARLHFIRFETKFIENAIDFIQKQLIYGQETTGKVIKVTGGGAYKYKDLIQSKLNLIVEKEDEMNCLIKGISFLLKNVASEAFSFERIHLQNSNSSGCSFQFQPIGLNFPYLLVNIGSGVSILKVSSEDDYERVGGTSMGGGTFWGLGILLTGAKGFDELLQLAEQGDHRNVDMLVRDIYAGAYETLGLPGDLIASSFGKATYVKSGKDDHENFEPQDLARSLLFTIANDIGQIACLYALNHQLKRIYFGGYFLRNHPLSMHAISFAIKYWSKGTVQALFLRHEGYLGAIGAFLKGTEETMSENYSWRENYAASSGLQMDGMSRDASPAKVEKLEIERADKIGVFPLLKDKNSYIPDVVDLSTDDEARIYWLKCFEDTLERITSKAIESQPEDPQSALNRALRFRTKLTARFKLLNSHPNAFGPLSVRSLLDTIEQSLREFEFPDPYLNQKKLENESALLEFPSRVQFIDSLPSRERNIELAIGLLAGNVFDWGAKKIAAILDGPEIFGLDEAKRKLESRPFLIDHLEEWLDTLEKKNYSNVIFFVDNSGIDFLLGVIPFVREMLKRGSNVILCSNSAPAINDMTFGEMVPLVQRIPCEVISNAVKEGRMKLQSTGQSSPCLDLTRVNQELNDLLNAEDDNLVIIEGMGRCIHTNLNAQFTSDSLKCAVIKNEWLAGKLGGKIGSVVFKYEKWIR